MNDNSFLKMLGLEYLDLDDVQPYFGIFDEGCRYYYKGRLNRFEKQLMKAEALLFDRIQDFAMELLKKTQREEDEEDQRLVIDYDEDEAVKYMVNRAKGCHVPLIEEGECLESLRKICNGFFEQQIRQRLEIPWVHGFLIDENYKVYWFFASDHPSYGNDEDELEC